MKQRVYYVNEETDIELPKDLIIRIYAQWGSCPFHLNLENT